MSHVDAAIIILLICAYIAVGLIAEGRARDRAREQHRLRLRHDPAYRHDAGVRVGRWPYDWNRSDPDLSPTINPRSIP